MNLYSVEYQLTLFGGKIQTIYKREKRHFSIHTTDEGTCRKKTHTKTTMLCVCVCEAIDSTHYCYCNPLHYTVQVSPQRVDQTTTRAP